MTGQSPEQLEQIRSAAGDDDFSRAAALLAASPLDPHEVRATLGSMPAADAASILSLLSPGDGVRALRALPPEPGGAILAALELSLAARLVAQLPSDTRADLLAATTEAVRTQILASLPASISSESTRLIQYPPDTAGGLMETEVLAYPAATTIREVIRDLRLNQQRYAALSVQYLYVVDDQRRLIGVVPMRDLLLAPEDARLNALQRQLVVSVRDTATTEELADLFDQHPFGGVPVLDAQGVLLGAVSRADATESEHQQSEEQYRVSQGIVGGEELRSMPVLLRVRRRAAWLGVNLVLGLGGAAIIAYQQDTIAKALVVAAVLPIISATSGNAAMQAAAVTIRELALDVVSPSSWRRVLWHELGLASIMALPLGLAVAALARFWGAGAETGLAVGLAMTINAVFAVGIGGVCPLALRRAGIDPALASGPITTTMADISGFALTLLLVGLLA